MKPLAIAACLALLTSACSTFTAAPTPPIPRPLPAADMVPTPPPQMPAGPTLSDLASSISQLLLDNAECREKQAGLVEWIKRGQ